MSSSKTAARANRHDVHRTNVEIPVKLWGALQTALKRRAAQLKMQHGVEVRTTFTAWLRAKAEETIAAYK